MYLSAVFRFLPKKLFYTPNYYTEYKILIQKNTLSIHTFNVNVFISTSQKSKNFIEDYTFHSE